MRNIIHSTLLGVSLLAGSVVTVCGQEVLIPDPALNAAVREALQKPNGPLSEQDMLRLTNLNASFRNISNIVGLEAARNLVSLDLEINRLASFSLPATLTNLAVLDLTSNSLSNCTFPTGPIRINSLKLSHNLIASFSLPSNLTRLGFFDLSFNGATNISLPSGLTNLTGLVIRGNNSLTDLNLPTGLTALETLDIDNNLLNHVALPAGMKQLTRLNLKGNQLFNLTLPAGMTNLVDLFLDLNHLGSLTLPADLTKLSFLELTGNDLPNLTIPGSLVRLTELHLPINRLSNFTLPSGLTNLVNLDLFENFLTNLTLPSGLTALTNLDLGVNQLTSLTVPSDATNLITLLVAFNQLTNVTVPPGLSRLRLIGLSGNRLRSLELPSGLTALAFLNLGNNALTNLTLPPDMQQLIGLFVNGNPLTTFVLSKSLAATTLAGAVATLQDQGVNVFTYPLAIQLVRPRPLVGAFQFGITGPPGVYTVLASTNLIAWSALRDVNNPLGSVDFTDETSNVSRQKFYRALRTPARMVFIAPSTFTMGSPAADLDSSMNERPQTTVTLTRGFWIGKFEVTQGEYLSVVGTNPSDFPGDPNRPVSSVTWFDATNYCWKLTQRELAAGRIPTGSRFRLPTEAEWECAARAGTTTRFSYGDDPQYAQATNYMWELFTADLTVHPVGQKLPNPSGLYDVHGNVWEWCQDWYGNLAGGVQTDPAGPVSNPDGIKVMRGGAYDYPNSSCRSASRFFRFANWPDSDVGFRVVLAIGP